MTDHAARAAEILASHRDSIDRLDAILVYTLGERFKHTQAVGRLKLVPNSSGWLRIVCSSERILRVFRITGLDKVFGIHPSLDEALAA